MSDSLSNSWPDLGRAWAGREMQMPAETAATSRVFQMGPLMKWLNPDAYAVTGPLGTIALNRDLIQKDNQSLDDVLTHELVHVRQGKKGFLRNFYNPTGVEREAIDYEAMHSKPRRGDINLPNEKGVKTGPTSEKLTQIAKSPSPTPVKKKKSFMDYFIRPEKLEPPANITGVRG